MLGMLSEMTKPINITELKIALLTIWIRIIYHEFIDKAVVSFCNGLHSPFIINCFLLMYKLISVNWKFQFLRDKDIFKDLCSQKNRSAQNILITLHYTHQMAEHMTCKSIGPSLTYGAAAILLTSCSQQSKAFQRVIK